MNLPKFNLKNSNLNYKLFSLSLILVILTLPFDIRLNGAMIALFTLLRIRDVDFRKNLKSIFSNKLLWVFISYYLFEIIGLLYTENLNVGLNLIETQLSLIIFPIALTNNSHLNYNSYKLSLKYFVLACFLVTLFCLSIALYRCFQIGELTFGYFYRENLLDKIPLHGVYFALYLIFSINIILFYLINNWSKINLVKKLLSFFLSIYFLAFIIILAPKMPLIAFFFTLVLIFFFIILKYKKTFLALLITFVLIFSGYGIYISVPYIQIRFQELVNTPLLPAKGDNFNSINLRVSQIECSIELISKKFLSGYGTGDVQDNLNQCYKSKSYSEELYNKNYNPHNQYFQALIGLGIMGLLCILTIICTGIVIAIKNNNYLYLIFLILISLCFLTETILNMQKGVSFFALFNSLFAFYTLKKEEPWDL